MTWLWIFFYLGRLTSQVIYFDPMLYDIVVYLFRMMQLQFLTQGSATSVNSAAKFLRRIDGVQIVVFSEVTSLYRSMLQKLEYGIIEHNNYEDRNAIANVDIM